MLYISDEVRRFQMIPYFIRCKYTVMQGNDVAARSYQKLSGLLNISILNIRFAKQVSDGYLLLVHGNFKTLQQLKQDTGQPLENRNRTIQPEMKKSLGTAVRTDDPCLPCICLIVLNVQTLGKTRKKDVVFVNPVFQFRILNTINSEHTHSLCRFQKPILLKDTESYVPKGSHFFLQPF